MLLGQAGCGLLLGGLPKISFLAAAPLPQSSGSCSKISLWADSLFLYRRVYSGVLISTQLLF